MSKVIDKLEIVICLGSSCFSRGNKKAVHLINAFLDEHLLRDKVNFHGAHCYGNCAHGAILRIGDKLFEEIDLDGLNDLLLTEMKRHVSVSPSLIADSEDSNIYNE